MPPFQPARSAMRASQTYLRSSMSCTGNASPLARTSTQAFRPFSSSQTTSAGEHAEGEHEEHSHYEPPTGWLWGIPPGQTYQKEGWEGIWYYGVFGGLLVTAVAYAFKPDTNIETWALEEAKRRLQAEGTLPEDE